MTTTRARGTDASSCQAKIDFKAYAAGGFDFIILKGSEGAKGEDPSFEPHIKAARDNGVIVPLAYHVLSPQSAVDAQLGNALTVALSYDVDICLDFELADPTMSPNQVCLRALAFAEGVVKAGRRCVVYSYPNFMRKLQGASSLALLAQTTDYWAADYPNEKATPEDNQFPWVPSAYQGRWLLWQFSGNGGTGAPGIPAIVDHCLWNGTREDLYKWIQGNKSETASGGPLATS